MNDDKKDQTETDPKNKDAAVKPDPETLHTTDPQENMEGPISSLMQKTKETFKENDQEEVEDKEA